MKEIGLVLLGLILGIPFAYFVEFSFPSIKAYFDRRSFSIRQKELASIQQEYNFLRRTKEYPSSNVPALVIELIIDVWQLTYLISGIGIFILIILYQPLLNPLIRTIILLIGIGFIVIQTYRIVSPISKTIRDLINVVDFDKYKEKTKVKIEKLGGNPEEMEKEEDKYKSKARIAKLLSEIEEEEE